MLAPCTDCARLVRSADVACPFCGSEALRVRPAGLRGRMSRAARLAGVAAIGVACGGSTDPTPSDGGADVVSVDAAYGGPFDAGKDAADASTADASDAAPTDAADASEDAKPDVPIFPPYGQAPLGMFLAEDV